MHRRTSFNENNRIYVELDLKNATNLRLLGTARKYTIYNDRYSSGDVHYEGTLRFFEQGLLIGTGYAFNDEYTAITSIKNILFTSISNVSGGISNYASEYTYGDENKKSSPANFKYKYTFSGIEFKLPSYNIDIKWLYDYIDPNYIEGKSPATNKNHD
jgi:hypothetical protein